ncbi:AAA family ATPase [Nocardioides sp.]|uniref:AAA family ATPase n=1 Tax=Nocardioides sp. TaxID=35761 RepID=UPI003D0E7416
MLVGRDTEQHLVAGLVAAARLGESAVLVVTGEPGIGKSTLLAHAAELAEGMQVHWVIGSEAEQGLAFAGLSQLFGPDVDLAGLPAPQAHALGVALALRSGQAVDRFAVGAATLGMLGRLAESRPRAIFIDDAHLLDPPSADALAFAVRRLVADPILVVVAVRASERSPLREAGLPGLDLGGLDLAAGLALLRAGDRSASLSDAEVERLVNATGGNPLALLEFADNPLERAGPDAPVPVSASLAAAFLARTGQLSPAAQQCLLVAATSGGERPVVADACERLGVDPGSLVEAADAGLIRLEAARIEFRHPLVRGSVYSAVSASARRAAHAALAAVTPLPEADRRAWHLAAAVADTDEEAAEALVGVAGRARARAAYDVCATALERAARLSTTPSRRAHRLLEAAEHAWIAGQGERSRSLLDQVGPTPLELVARIGSLAGLIAARTGSLTEAVDIYAEAAERVAASDPDAAVELLADGINASFYRADREWMAQALEQLELLVPRTRRQRSRVLGHLAIGMVRILLGKPGVETLRVAIVDLVAAETLRSDPIRVEWLVMAVLFLREDGTFHGVVEEAVDATREGTVLGTLPYLLFLVSRDAATSDRWAEAESGYHEGIRLSRESGQTTNLGLSLAGLAWLEARQGRAEQCREHAAEAVALGERFDIVVSRVWAAWALAELDLGRGDATGALAALETVCELLELFAIEDVDMYPGAELAETLLRLGRDEEAAVVAADFLTRATLKGQPWALARAHRACAQLSGDQDGFARALAHHADTRDSFEQARTELAQGSALRRSRQRRAARPVLLAAYERFGSLGAPEWAEQAAAELEATGETVRRRGADARDSLTPQESQIARLLAAGQTTRQAAAALFLSPKTVEYHLRHVYLKLGISSRAELAKAMGPVT